MKNKDYKLKTIKLMLLIYIYLTNLIRLLQKRPLFMLKIFLNALYIIKKRAPCEQWPSILRGNQFYYDSKCVAIALKYIVASRLLLDRLKQWGQMLVNKLELISPNMQHGKIPGKMDPAMPKFGMLQQTNPLMNQPTISLSV